MKITIYNESGHELLVTSVGHRVTIEAEGGNELDISEGDDAKELLVTQVFK